MFHNPHHHKTHSYVREQNLLGTYNPKYDQLILGDTHHNQTQPIFHLEISGRVFLTHPLFLGKD